MCVIFFPQTLSSPEVTLGKMENKIRKNSDFSVNVFPGAGQIPQLRADVRNAAFASEKKKLNIFL